MAARTLWDDPLALPTQPQLAQIPVGLGPIERNPSGGTPSCENIYELVCQKKGESHDLTGFVRTDVVGERLAWETYHKIIQEHSEWTSEQVDEELVKQIFEPKKKKNIEDSFRWVRHMMETFIERQPPSVFTAQEKRQIKGRLRATQLELPPPASLYQDEPDLFTRNGAYYERTLDGKMRLRVGGAYVFIAKSKFNLINTLAHELAHAIDPCEIRAAHLSFPAYDRLTACFLGTGLIATRKNRSECGANDQLSETFADWMAVQAVAEYLKHFATEFRGPEMIHDAAINSVRDLCDEENESSSELDLELHPSAKIRIEKIFGAHPTIRQLLGCGPLPDRIPYCGFESNFPSKDSE